jgi:PEP-CTERM motif
VHHVCTFGFGPGREDQKNIPSITDEEVPVIKKLIQAAALLAACSGAAQASTYDFSYTFTDGQEVTGALDGTLSGDLVTDISNVSVDFKGTAFNGPLFIGSFDSSSGGFTYAANSAVVSTNAALNNFVINDSNDPFNNNSTNSFYYFNGATPDLLGSHEANVSTNAGPSDYDNDQTSGIGQWSLTPAPVPLPAALPLMISGLGLLAAAKRRRQAAAA